MYFGYHSAKLINLLFTHCSILMRVTGDIAPIPGTLRMRHIEWDADPSQGTSHAHTFTYLFSRGAIATYPFHLPACFWEVGGTLRKLTQAEGVHTKCYTDSNLRSE